MKITFIKDCPAIFESGNEAYKAGTEADLRRGQSLIELGYAQEGWGDIQGNDTPDFSSLSDDELKAMAKEQGVKSYWLMNRDTLIERLTNGDN